MRCCLCETRAFPQPGWPSVVPLCRQCRVDLEARAQEPRPEEPKRLSLTPSYIERCQHLALAGANVALRPTVVIDLAAVRASRLAGAAAVLIALFAVFYCAPAAAQVQPYVYNVAVGTSSAQALAQNTTRKRVVFVNSSDTAKIAVQQRDAGAVLADAFNQHPAALDRTAAGETGEIAGAGRP